MERVATSLCPVQLCLILPLHFPSLSATTRYSATRAGTRIPLLSGKRHSSSLAHEEGFTEALVVGDKGVVAFLAENQRSISIPNGRVQKSRRMFSVSRRALLLALVATAALLAPAAAATTDSMADATGSTASDQETEPYASDATVSDTAEDDNDEPEDSGLECQVDFVGDGQCDNINNSASCNYDGGDCCECTCTPGDYNCGGNYDCTDPDAACVDDDDGDGGVQTTMDLGTDDRLGGTTDDEDEAGGNADETDADTGSAGNSATGSRPFSFISTGIAAVAGAAVVFAGWGI